MPLRLPSFPEILAVSRSCGRDSDAPHLWHGLVGAWPMQEGGGGLARDVSGYDCHGTLTDLDPATDWLVTEKGWALDFDGTNNVLLSNFPSVVSDLTWTAWIRTTYSGTRKILFGAYSAFSPYAGWGVGFGTGNVSFWSGSSEEPGWKDSNTGYNSGNWTFVAVTLLGTVVTFYRNGFLDRVDASVTPGAYTGAKRIAARTDGAQEWAGSLTLSAVHSRALSPAEIQQLYADPWAMYRPRTRVFPAAAAGPPPSFQAAWAAGINQYIGIGA